MLAGRVDPAIGRAGIVALFALALDQLTKLIARAELQPGERAELGLGIELRRLSNEGIAFGLFDELGTAVVVVAGLGFLLLLGYFLASSERERLWLPIGLLAGGAVGNLVDRIALGAVTDFIDLPRWPTFNLADVAITLGVVLMAVILWRGERDGEGRARCRGAG